MDIKSYLYNLPFQDLFELIKSTEIISDFNYGVDDDGMWVSANNEIYYPEDSGYDILVSEGISRLRALPHMMVFNGYICKALCADIDEKWTGTRGSKYKDGYDYDIYASKKVEGGRNIAHTTVEVKCREKELYTLDYYKTNKVMVNLDKQTKAEYLYTQTSDGYGLIFTMDSAEETASTVTDATTAALTDKKVKKDRIYFSLDKAVLMIDPIEGTKEDFEKYFKNYY